MGKSKFQSLEVDDGQEVRLTLPEPYREGYWQISDDRGNSWKRLQVERGAVLMFNATLDDNGLIYRAKVGRDLYSTPVKLRVRSCPKITQPPENIQTTEGSSVSFSVQATDVSGCSLGYQWQRNGKDIRRANKSTLVIPFVTSLNVGTYTVIVSNEHCCTSASAELSLETLPEPEPQPSVVNRGILRTSRPHHPQHKKKTVQIKEPSSADEYLNNLSERLLQSQLKITEVQTEKDDISGIVTTSVNLTQDELAILRAEDEQHLKQEYELRKIMGGAMHELESTGVTSVTIPISIPVSIPAQEEQEQNNVKDEPEKEWYEFVSQHNNGSSTISVPVEYQTLEESEHAVREALDKAWAEKKAEERTLSESKEASEHAVREALDRALEEEKALKEAEEKALQEATQRALKEEEEALQAAQEKALKEQEEDEAYRLAEEEAFKRVEESLRKEEEIAKELEKAKLLQDIILAEARKLAEERELEEKKSSLSEVTAEKEGESEEPEEPEEPEKTKKDEKITLEIVSEEPEDVIPEEEAKEEDEETTLEDESSNHVPVSRLVQA